jgi:hypothetical protein
MSGSQYGTGLGHKSRPFSPHGGGVRGEGGPARSAQFEGRFGRLFRTLPPAEFAPEDLQALAAQGAMSAEPELSDGGLPAAAPEDPKTRIHDAEENGGIDAGYTYLGQFIDHDITFDPTSSLDRQNDPDALVDFRTPRLDLDSLYGRGPDDQPYLYTSDGRHFLLGRELTEGTTVRTRDLPRFEWTEDAGGRQAATGAAVFQRALIGDKRNDENVIVSQLHGSMLQFHNRLADDHPEWSFAEVQRHVRWHYQYVVANDFLPRIVGRPMVESILPHLAHGGGCAIVDYPPQFRLYHPRHDSFIPIEFTGAAYRFGHSMVRPIYRLSQALEVFDEDPAIKADEVKRGLAGRLFVFAGIRFRGLNGFGAFPRSWAIDWSLYFDIDGSGKKVGKARVQPAYKLDTSLVNPLAFLPEFSVANASPPLTLKTLQAAPRTPPQLANLAERNLRRGVALGLPSGQDVARAIGEQPLADSEILIGKATFEDAFENKANRPITSFGKSFAGRAPLWTYVLAEAQAGWVKAVVESGKKGDEADQLPVRMGPVGGRIVAETLLGMLWGDKASYLRQNPGFISAIPTSAGGLTMGDIIKYALQR